MDHEITRGINIPPPGPARGSQRFRGFLVAALGCAVVAGCATGPFAPRTAPKPSPPVGGAGSASGPAGSTATNRPAPAPPPQKAVRTQSFSCADGTRITLVFLNPPDQLRVERAGKPPALLNAKTLKTTFRYLGSGFEVIGRKDGGVDLSVPGQLVTGCMPTTRAR